MRAVSFLQLLGLFAVGFLAARTSCYPRHGFTALAATDNGHDRGVSSILEFKSVERAARTSLRRRSLGFQQFLEIGNGWNMYYSSWPSIVLPVRKYKCTLQSQPI